MKKSLAIILTLVLALGVFVGIGISAYAEESSVITIPEVTVEATTYTTLEEMGLTDLVDEMRATFPKSIEIKYENGVLSIPFNKAASAEFYSFANYETYQMTLVDGYWTLEIDESIYDGLIDYKGNGGEWYARYRGGAIEIIEVYFYGESYCSLRIHNSYTQFIYYSEDDCEVTNEYDLDGNLTMNEVKYYSDDRQLSVVVKYNQNSEPQLMSLLSDNTWYHYFPGQGWSTGSWEFEAADAPVGYEDADEEYFMSLAPCQIPNYDVELPTIEIPDAPPQSLLEAGVNVSEIWSAFPSLLDASYENGVLKVRDIGLGKPQLLSYYHNDWLDFTIDGKYYTLELSEEEYEAGFAICFMKNSFSANYKGIELNSISYDYYPSDNPEFFYQGLDIHRDGTVTLTYSSKTEECYRSYEITYVSDKITDAQSYYSNDSKHLYNYYNFDGTLYCSEFYDANIGSTYYYLPDSGWSLEIDIFVPTDAPEFFKNCSEGQIMALAPTYGICDHKWTDATCLVAKTCVKCGLCEGELAKHDYADADCDTPKTCLVCSATEGEALGHSFTEGKCTVCEAEDPNYVPETPNNPEDKNEPTDSATGEPKEENWLMKLIQMIIDFFKKLFGIK